MQHFRRQIREKKSSNHHSDLKFIAINPSDIKNIFWKFRPNWIILSDGNVLTSKWQQKLFQLQPISKSGLNKVYLQINVRVKNPFALIEFPK